MVLIDLIFQISVSEILSVTVQTDSQSRTIKGLSVNLLLLRCNAVILNVLVVFHQLVNESIRTNFNDSVGCHRLNELMIM